MLVTPYDIGWGYLVNFNHDFVGKDALAKAKAAQAKKMVTLEWNADDIADVFASQFRGKDVAAYDPIEAYHDGYNGSAAIHTRGDWVVAEDGTKIGVSCGRTYAFYEQHMISLCSLKADYAIGGKEYKILWGRPGTL